MYLERLARCPGTEDRQGTADLAALETPEGVASLPAPFHFWAKKAGAGCTSRAFKHPGHDVTAPDVWPSILTDYTYDSELDNADGVPLAFRRSSMFPEGNFILSEKRLVNAIVRVMFEYMKDVYFS